MLYYVSTDIYLVIYAHVCLIGLDLLLAVSADLAQPNATQRSARRNARRNVPRAAVQYNLHLYSSQNTLRTVAALHSPTMDSGVDSAGPSNQRYNRVCSENFGQPHVVSLATWYRHYQAASAEEREQMQRAKLDGITSSSDCRPRGTASHRRNGILPVQKRARELGEGQVSASPDKRGRQGEPEVFFCAFVISLYLLT